MKVIVSGRDGPVVTGQGQMPQSLRQDPERADQPSSHLSGTGQPCEGHLLTSIEMAGSHPVSPSGASTKAVSYPRVSGGQKHRGQRNNPLGLGEGPNWI